MKETKQNILVAAANLFLSKGFEGTSVADISQLIGLSNAIMYRYFKSKEELYRKVVDIYFIEKQNTNIKYKKSDETFTDFIDAYINEVASIIKSLQTFNKSNVTSASYMAFMFEAGNRYEDCAQNYLNQDKLVFDLWKTQIEAAIKRKEIREDIDVETVVGMFMFAFYGSSYISAFEKGLNPKRLKEIYYKYYELIKINPEDRK